MRSWNSPLISPLPASGLPVRLHDSRTDRIAPVPVLTQSRARLYVCGITPYDATHLGHAATYHAADLMRRAFLDQGLEVEVAQNVTDVDDPLLERAARDGIDWKDLAERETDLFREDMEHLRILAPQTYRSVSESMDEIIDLVQELRASGRAYRVPTADASGDDWYLDLAMDGSLGAVCGWDQEQMLEVFADRGGDPEREGKRGIFDPLLWRAEREGEPAWDAAELGRGRPGWHVECVCISRGALGLPFDVQAGGRDLVFPHHDMCAAHATALGRPFAGTYPHTGMVAYEGEKMSKSLGNLVFVSRLVARGVDPMAIRLVLMDHHYRSDWEWTDEDLEHAQRRLDAYRAAARREAGDQADAYVVAGLRAALREDLDTPQALVLLDAWAAGESVPSSAVPTEDPGAERPADVPAALDALFGITLTA
ncbi:cysteine--1-D-myo-inosityl 2-amino-2-deoxy-alpha-D-glucopyranoside ligase [Brachybacterium endophyticum]|uniref:L-cysteine:1D-myo-inositol 2-amino-2-deoxy-alpha-D-glucopyranoside ligase n=1 Tax=Brachybacterium endophyticum TaxID=2182385 RepID=A0A2U2RIG3_9MICO|nr:cysteine--1-D-myo-inosityl 2-amino-2-deoxy-alpha-D-glucopyranoside ligase [Brachybacterium endophyticum]PWH05669.1 cysteine--1-D-myo-inosityl 2-amino-2-deoxy-alpha-D-glucopyranoside ligase [Brachybacterium endophyticum]